MIKKLVDRKNTLKAAIALLYKAKVTAPRSYGKATGHLLFQVKYRVVMVVNIEKNAWSFILLLYSK